MLAVQGYSVSLSGDGTTAIVGGNADANGTGAAWVWTRSGGVWTQQGTKLVGSGYQGAPFQGHSVSLAADGNTAIVGGYGDNGSAGATWVWTRSGGVWTQLGAKLVGSGAVGFLGAYQGSAVSLSADGKTAIVGGFMDNVAAGAAWVFTAPLPEPTVTTQPASRTVMAGRTASFSAAATGSPAPTVQWQVSTNNGSTWNDIGGATSTTHAFTATAADHGKWLRAVFTNSVSSATSVEATLTVRSVSGSDFNGDAATDMAVYRPTTGMWLIRDQSAVQFGGPGYVAVTGDYNGDGTTDVAVYQPSNGTWHVRNQSTTQFGDPGDTPVAGDYNGDGTTDLAVYRPSTGSWFVRNQFAVPGFGGADYIPVAADYNGDGTTDVAVYRPSTGFW